MPNQFHSKQWTPEHDEQSSATAGTACVSNPPCDHARRLEAEVEKLRQEREILDQLAAKRAETIKSEREARERAEKALREAQGVQEYLVSLIEASRDALAAFQKQAGWLPQQQAYSTKMTEAEIQIAKVVQDLTGALSSLKSSEGAK